MIILRTGTAHQSITSLYAFMSYELQSPYIAEFEISLYMNYIHCGTWEFWRQKQNVFSVLSLIAQDLV